MNHMILDRPIAFHRGFVKLTGSINAALMLSQAVYWQQRCKSDDGWWWKTQEDWTEETGMSRKEQEWARRKLTALSFWEEARKGVPAKMFYRVDLDKLMIALDNLECPKGAAQYAQKGQSGMPKRDNHLKDTETTEESTSETTKKRSAKTPSKPEAPNPPEWLDPNVWREWLDHRKQIKHPVTDLAARKAIAELSRLRDQGHDPVKVIEHSILNGWRGLFPPKTPPDRRLRSEFEFDLTRMAPPPGWGD